MALRFWKVVEELGALRSCSESSGVMKEFEDLLEDEEEDVVCAALDSSIKIVTNFTKAFHMQPKVLER